MALNLVLSFALVFISVALGSYLVYRRIAPVTNNRSFFAPAKGSLGLCLHGSSLQSKTQPLDTTSFISQLTTASSILAEHHARFMADVTNIRRAIDAFHEDNSNLSNLRRGARTAHDPEALAEGPFRSFFVSLPSAATSEPTPRSRCL